MEKQEAIREITTKVRLLESKRTLDEGLLTFYVEKLVMDILDYCHRADFPDALIYSSVDLIRKRFADEDASAGSELGIQAAGPLSSVKMDDTEFSLPYRTLIRRAALPISILRRSSRS